MLTQTKSTTKNTLNYNLRGRDSILRVTPNIKLESIPYTYTLSMDICELHLGIHLLYGKSKLCLEKKFGKRNKKYR